MTTDEFRVWVESVGGNGSAARLLGISAAQVSNYLSGRRKIGQLMTQRIDRANGEANDVHHGVSSTESVKAIAPVAFVDNSTRIRFYPQKVNAGQGVPLESSTPFERKVDKSLVNNVESSFCVFASGDSMLFAGILDGSFLVCEQIKRDPHDLVGQIVIACIGGITIVKRLVEEDGIYKLRSESPKKYKDVILSEDAQGLIQGVVLSVHTDIKNYKHKS